MAVCPSAATAREKLPALAPDVVLMDIRLPDGNGADLLGELLPRLPKTEFVVLTVFEEDETIERAIRNGASGYLLKHAGGTQIVQAVREVCRGGALDFGVSRRVLAMLRERPQPAVFLPDLTPQENRLLCALTQGATVKEAATTIGVTYASARTYLRRMYVKLGVHSRMEAVRRFLGLVPPEASAARMGRKTVK